MFKTKYECEVCEEICPAYTSHPLEILKNGVWKFHLKIYDTPMYFNKKEDVYFCSAGCMLKWHKKKC